MKPWFPALLTLLLGAAPLLTHAQELNGRFSLGPHAGMTTFIGDVSTREFIPNLSSPNEIRWGAGLQATLAVNPYLSFRYNWISGRLYGGSQVNNRQFRTRFQDHSVQALVNMSSIFFYDPDRSDLQIYGIIGYGINSFRSQLTTYSTNAHLAGFGIDSRGNDAGKPTRELSIPVGISLRTRLDKFIPVYNGVIESDRFELMLDMMLHFVNTDKLDAYIDNTGKDKFTYVSLGLTYFFFD